MGRHLYGVERRSQQLGVCGECESPPNVALPALSRNGEEIPMRVSRGLSPFKHSKRRAGVAARPVYSPIPVGVLGRGAEPDRAGTAMPAMGEGPCRRAAEQGDCSSERPQVRLGAEAV